MSFYKYASMPDPYCYPNSDVLRNKLGITDGAQLEVAEIEHTLIRLGQLQQNPVAGRFGFTHLKNIHKSIFCDIYEWAGKPRSAGFISKGGSIFCRSDYIDDYAGNIFNGLAKEKKLKGLEHDDFLHRLAYYSSEINALHPFRDGNGRSRREFIRQLAAHNDYAMAWYSVPPKEMLAADISAFNADYAPLVSVFSRILKRNK